MPPSEGGPKRPTHEYDWLAIRRDHAKGMTISAIAKKYGVRRQTIQDRKTAEGWSDTNGQLADKAVRQAIEDEAKNVASAVGQGIIESLQLHGELASKLMEYAKKTLEDGIAGSIRPGEKQSKADVFNTVVAGVKTAVVVSREIAGITAGKPSVGENPDDAKIDVRWDDQPAASA